MAEKIVNGGLSSLSSWANIGAYSFSCVSGRARGSSSPTSDEECGHTLTQDFSVSGECISATLSAWISWLSVAKAGGDGSNLFTIKLLKPDDTTEVLVQDDYSGEANSSGWLAVALDISDYIDMVGTYQLQLELVSVSAWYIPIDEPVYYPSQGEYDNISVIITERFTKMVLEGIGGGELVGLSASKAVLEGAGLTESLAHVGGGPGKMLKFEKCGFYETLEKVVSVAKIEGAGLHETLTRTYGYRQHDVPGIPFVAGLKESLRARFQQGNMTIIREIVSEADIWTDLAKEETDWETT